MTSKIKKGLFYLAAGFCLLFALRLAYGYWNPNAARGSGSLIGGSRPEFEFSKKNYASEKFLAPTAAGQQSYSVDQKYEKVGSMDSKTSAFERDEARVRAAIDYRHALIQYERSSGLSGRRHIELALGVVPIEFDHLVQDLKHIGVWTIQYYLLLLAWLLGGAILTLIAVSLAEKLKLVTITPQPKPQPKEG